MPRLAEPRNPWTADPIPQTCMGLEPGYGDFFSYVHRQYRRSLVQIALSHVGAMQSGDCARFAYETCWILNRPCEVDKEHKPAAFRRTTLLSPEIISSPSEGSGEKQQAAGAGPCWVKSFLDNAGGAQEASCDIVKRLLSWVPSLLCILTLSRKSFMAAMVRAGMRRGLLLSRQKVAGCCDVTFLVWGRLSTSYWACSLSGARRYAPE